MTAAAVCELGALAVSDVRNVSATVPNAFAGLAWAISAAAAFGGAGFSNPRANPPEVDVAATATIGNAASLASLRGTRCGLGDSGVTALLLASLDIATGGSAGAFAADGFSAPLFSSGVNRALNASGADAIAPAIAPVTLWALPPPVP